MKRLQHATRRAERDGVPFGALVPIELTVMYKSQSYRINMLKILSISYKVQTGRARQTWEQDLIYWRMRA